MCIPAYLFIVALFVIGKTWKQTQCPVNYVMSLQRNTMKKRMKWASLW